MSHSPEPWKLIRRNCDAGGYRVDGPSSHVWCDATDTNHFPDEEDARRIVACVNFCREFSTEFLEGRQLKYLHSKDDLVGPDYQGHVACMLIPLVKSKDAP